MTDVVGKLWGFCHTLRHDGIDYGDYIEQITYLLFLKMADEKGVAVPAKCSWPKLRDKSGTDLIDHYIDVLRDLGKSSGMLGAIYAGSQSRFNNPVSLKRLIGLIDETQWTALGVDVKAEAYEGLLEKAASEGKKGAGQYFTPRVLIQSIVRCMQPDPRGRKGFTICDPACGTGGFLVAAYEWLMAVSKGALAREDARRIRKTCYHGTELVARPRRLALMNLYLHGIEPDIRPSDAIYEPEPGERYDVILTNPPFGTKGAGEAPTRDDFTVATSNKQLNFVQHVLTILKPGGRAAVVLPDNCLFADQAGEVFKIVTQDANLHTVLRLPRGTFSPYSQGVKANVVFFTKGYPTETTWVYDGRTNVAAITKKGRPFAREHFFEFEKCYGADPSGTASRRKSTSTQDRWRSFHIAEIKERDYKLDRFKWLREESTADPDDLPEPEEITSQAIDELQGIVRKLKQIIVVLGTQSAGSAANGSKELPEGWAALPVRDVGDVRLGRQRAPRYHQGPNMRPYLRVANVFEDRIDTSDVMEMDFSPGEYAVYKLEPGDILLNEGQSTDLIGRPAMYRGELPGVCFTNSLIRFRADRRLTIPEYALALFRHYLHSGEFRMLGTISTNIAHLSAGRFASMPFPLPPLAEQRRIVTALTALLGELGGTGDNLARLSLLLDGTEAIAWPMTRVVQAILARVFRGDLVPTEAEIARREGRDYESAEALIARVRATRTAPPPTSCTSVPPKPPRRLRSMRPSAASAR